ncbi:N-acetylglucosamine-6-phosphate deacetylase [Corynebacterium falsenii]|uniref:N-acetylglucosamine-6-phosphate deacetylase n=1 Tax=Corynebacterium falsenii TaxID=108486 RepID=UPI00234D043F|nr:N-acetylglucosamine-6-phosphate deacetylase [Corynebacterium falsenii]MDC7104002.1 N-acetylglucosamine-6-phosphate deacetylase [Corynebacterium falsenii]
MSDQAPDPSPAPTAAPQFDPIMVLARAEGERGPVYAVWQVETDPTVTLGDFSGAWVITADGIQGFASSADWIENRSDQRSILTTLLRYPVLLTEGVSVEDVRGGVDDKDLPIIDRAATQHAAEEAIAGAKETFAKEFPEKRQPAWGTVEPLEPDAARAPETEGQDPATTSAITDALATAKGLRAWIRQWNAFDKLRVRRLGEVDDSLSELQGVPLRLTA